MGEMAGRGEAASRCRDHVSSPIGPTAALLQPMNSRGIGGKEEPEIRPQTPVFRDCAGSPGRERGGAVQALLEHSL